RRREALGADILIVERDLRDIGDGYGHAGRLQLDRGAQRRHVEGALAQAAANAENGNASGFAHSPLLMILGADRASLNPAALREQARRVSRPRPAIPRAGAP